jgi:hypothetical protein
VEAVQFSEGVMDGGVEGAGHHQGAELGNRLGQLQLPGDLGRRLQISRFQGPVDVDRVAVLAVSAGELGDSLGQRFIAPAVS